MACEFTVHADLLTAGTCREAAWLVSLLYMQICRQVGPVVKPLGL